MTSNKVTITFEVAPDNVQALVAMYIMLERLMGPLEDDEEEPIVETLCFMLEVLLDRGDEYLDRLREDGGLAEMAEQAILHWRELIEERNRRIMGPTYDEKE